MKVNGRRLGVVLVALAVLGLGGLALTAFISQPDPQEILTQVIETLDAAQDGHAILRIDMDGPEKSGWSRVEVWGKKVAGGDTDSSPPPHMFRMEVREASKDEAVGAVAVSNGEQLWFYSPARNTVRVGQVDEMHPHDGDMPEPPFDMPADPIEMVQWIMGNFEVTLLGTEEVAGHSAYKLELVPRPEALPEAAAAGVIGTLWVDQERALPLQVSFDGGEMGHGQVLVEEVALDLGLSDDLFTFQIPEGTTVEPLEKPERRHLTLEEAEAAVDFDLLMPAELPQKATLVDVLKVEGAVVLRYESPAGSFAISQGADAEALRRPAAHGEPVSVRGTTGTLFTSPAGTRVFLLWEEDGQAFSVSGALSAEEALRIAESLQ